MQELNSSSNTQISKQDAEFVILGGGLAGMTAASELGERAVVLERDARPGGLVRAENFDGYWFDWVIHLLYFADPQTKERIRNLMGDDLAACVPQAWVECESGTVRFPFQTHLGGLESETVVRCLEDFARVTHEAQKPVPHDFRAMLEQSFGTAMCETFFFPYNRKMWKRPLESLAPSGFQWNIVRPPFDAVLRGALKPQGETGSYNAEGWYPRPPADAPCRGMEVLARALATQVTDLRLGHTVREIDLDAQTVRVAHDGQETEFHWTGSCCSSLPLPLTVAMCRQAPEELKQACRDLTRNRVLSVALSIRGPRPDSGHWRYYTDESIVFNRLIFLHQFDPGCAPPEGWPLLAEITEPAENPMASDEEILARTRADVARVGGLPDGSEIIAERVMLIDPAYVVFTPENQKVVEEARQWLQERGVVPLGRYGKWEYSSMAQVMRDGFAWGQSMAQSPAQSIETPTLVGNAV